MIRYLKNRLRAYIDRAVRDCVTAYADTIKPKEIDTEEIAEQVLYLVKTGHTLEYESLAECIDISELAGQFTVHDIAGEVDCQWVAEHLPVSEIAENFDVNALADYIDLEALAAAFSADDLADKLAGGLDYKCLAAAILKELRPVEVRPSA
jgi:hypothetical protein